MFDFSNFRTHHRTHTELRAVIDRESKLSIRVQCELLGLHPSVLYYQPVAATEENLSIMRLLNERYLNYPTEVPYLSNITKTFLPLI